jgi:multicomponent K+:H+ antiporter subunit E
VSRLFPQPAMTVSLFIAWLLLNNSLAAATLIMAALLAVAVPLLTQRYWPEYPKTVRVVPMAKLIALVLFDIIIANLRLVPLILGPTRRLQPRFLEIPLDLREPFTITLLASIITLTPGTVSANVSGDRRTLLVHGLRVLDEAAAVAGIKHRYERRLKEVFE